MGRTRGQDSKTVTMAAGELFLIQRYPFHLSAELSCAYGKAVLTARLAGRASLKHRHVERSENACRFIGFGVPNILDALDCAANRATLVGFGELSPGNAHQYRVPLPGGLEQVTDPRSLTVSAEHLASYAGTTPRLHSSGDRTRYGRTRPDVNRYLKWAFAEAANSVAVNAARCPQRHVSQLYSKLAGAQRAQPSGRSRRPTLGRGRLLRAPPAGGVSRSGPGSDQGGVSAMLS